MIFVESLKEVKKMGLKTICGLSNVSFGLPKRKIINATLLAEVRVLGIDAVIIDPVDELIHDTILSTNVLLNEDNYCLNYIKEMRRKSR